MEIQYKQQFNLGVKEYDALLTGVVSLLRRVLNPYIRSPTMLPREKVISIMPDDDRYVSKGRFRRAERVT
jgi:hypothetical protein